jgi:membrane protein required for colicin V production
MNFSITILDALIVLVIIVSAGYAAWRGFLWETLTIFEWVAAAFACLYFGPYLIPMARSMVEAPWLASVLAYAVVFLTVFIPLAFISHRFTETVKHSPIGPLDRAAGVAFGVVRGLVIVGLAYLAFTYFVPIRNQPGWVTRAELMPVVQTTADLLLSVVPDQSRDYASIPHHDEVRQAPARHDPVADLIHSDGRAAARDDGKPAKTDAMGELIRRNEAANSVPKTTREPVTPQTTPKTTATAKKSYGAGDRQALDKLIETGGNGTR